MRVAFFLAVVLGLIGWTARADHLYIKIDLNQVYQNLPSKPAALGKNPVISALPVKPLQFNSIEGQYVTVVIEAKTEIKFEGKKELGGGWRFNTVWSKDGPARFLAMPELTPRIIKYTLLKKDDAKFNKNQLAKEFEDTFKAGLANTKDPQKFLTAATWALQHGLAEEFHATMNDWQKISPAHPVCKNYARIVETLKAPPTSDDPQLKNLIADLTSPSSKYVPVGAEGGFYTAYTNLGPESQAAVRRRANRLQKSLENFYFWFALQPQLPQPPLPQYKMLLIIPKSNDEFYAKQNQWGSPPISGEAFLAPRDNVIVMSWHSTNETYKAFSTNNQILLQKSGFSKDAFVNGIIWDRKYETSDRDPFRIAFIQTLILAQKAMEEEEEIATLTHQGIRQLLVASDILPRNVHVPDWISHGLACYFETPLGAPYPGFGVPNWSELIAFKHLRANKRFDKGPDALRLLLSDRYFRNVQNSIASLSQITDREKNVSRLKAEMELANSSAWAFVYFLIERRRTPQLLFNYCQELNTLPRDLDLDERALEACFAKVFGVADPANPHRIDPAKLNALGDAWFTEMAGVSLELPELQREYLELRQKAKKSAN